MRDGRRPAVCSRRTFFRLAGLPIFLSVAAPVAGAMDAAFPPAQIEHQGRCYRGTADGRILVSADRGRTWREIANFGPSVRIERFSANERDAVSVQLRNRLHRFRLRFKGDHIWLTEAFPSRSEA